jgi:hypothetical protein
MTKDEERGKARDDDPISAKEAAAGIEVSRVQALIYKLLVERGAVAPNEFWMSRLQLESIMWPAHRIDKWTISPRMIEMERKNIVQCITKVGANTTGKPVKLKHYRAIRAPVKPLASKA